ncbi:VOC family protein [Saccharothrix australiensis]|uniref:Glyoxalase-like domain-containing protein n=1 Tax=Saccharothrix australiensis TaxID=2072 RepID=A0A495VZ12_9PSEU|nr:VOC family protein [Saccharothrix australiensis]RKT54100.1 hypothetical protein C8E97_2694 [Saccharothrix australiensis]
MAKQVQVVVDCVDPGRLARFWASALDYRLEPPPQGYASWSDFSRAAGVGEEAWNAVFDPDGVGPRVLFQRVPERKVGKNRVHLDVRVAGPRGTPKESRRALVDAEAARLVEGGAKHVRTVEDEMDCFAVMQDPEGNEFCIC